MDLLTVYFRKEPTTDSVVLDLAKKGIIKLDKRHMDVVVYKDRECKDFYARFAWHQSKPGPKSTTVMLNCYRWYIVWLPPAKADNHA